MIKSKKTTLKLLICVLAMLVLATVLVACNIGNGPEHYDYRVTFEYNVGIGDNALKGNTSTQYLGVFENSLVIIRPGYNTDFEEGVVSGYYLEGWYLPAHVDENGEPLRDENGFVILGNKWNFNTMRVNEDITLYGNFVKKLAIRFINRTTGEYIDDTIEYNPNANVLKPTSQAPTLTNHTFLGKYYTTIDGDEEVTWNFRITDDMVIYVDFIEGIWSLVSTASEFRTAISARRNIYLLEDIDFKENSNNNTLWDFTEYTGSINGNGHTISNVTRNLTASKPYSDSNIESFGGIFGSLSESAYIYDINFVNVNVTFEINSSYQLMDAYVGLLAGKADDKAKIEKVTISGTLTYKPYTDKTINVGIIGNNKGDIKEDCDFSAAEITAA